MYPPQRQKLYNYDVLRALQWPIKRFHKNNCLDFNHTSLSVIKTETCSSSFVNPSVNKKPLSFMLCYQLLHLSRLRLNCFAPGNTTTNFLNICSKTNLNYKSWNGVLKWIAHFHQLLQRFRAFYDCCGPRTPAFKPSNSAFVDQPSFCANIENHTSSRVIAAYKNLMTNIHGPLWINSLHPCTFTIDGNSVLNALPIDRVLL